MHHGCYGSAVCSYVQSLQPMLSRRWYRHTYHLREVQEGYPMTWTRSSMLH